MNKLKKMLAMIMVVAVLAPATAFAAGQNEQEEEIQVQDSSHTHSWVACYTSYTYRTSDSENHRKYAYKVSQCSTCGEYKQELLFSELESHSWGESYYTGSNYHSGAYHFFEYAHECKYCHQIVVTENKRIACPGGDTHVTIMDVYVPGEEELK